MKMIIYPFIALIIFLFISCHTKKTRNTLSNNKFLELKINSSEVKKDVKMSEFIRNYYFINLETTQDCLIGRISKIIIYKNLIFILDKFSAKSLFVFDKDGKFLRKIGETGEGPGEYFIPLDFTINRKNDEVIILEGNKLLYYELNGRYLKEKILNFSGSYIESYEPDKLAFISGNIDDNLIISNIKGKKIVSFFPYIDRNINKLTLNPIQTINDSLIIYRRYLNDTIFLINNSDLQPYRYINFGIQSFSQKKYLSLSKSQKNNFKTFFTKNNYDIVKNYFETKENILVYLHNRSKPYIAIFSKKTGEKLIFPFYDMINDITFEKESTYVIGTDGKFFIHIVQPYALIKALNNFTKMHSKEYLDRNKYFQIIYKIADKIEKTSNPILMFAVYEIK